MGDRETVMARTNTPADRRIVAWQESAPWGVCLVVVYMVLALLPVALALLVRPSPKGGLLEEIAKGAAMVGFALLALQVGLSARIKAVDRPFGLDVVMQFHRGMAILAGILLVLHPVLLAVGGHGWGLFRLRVPWQINLGRIALLLLLLTVAGALLRGKVGFPYQVWRFLHKGAIAVVVVGFVHGLVIGPDLRHWLLRAYWWALVVGAVALFLYRNMLAPFWGRRRFTVSAVRPETHDTFTLAMEPEDGRPLCHRPGQFMFLRLCRPGRPSEEHPFTISSSPTTEPPLTATIKMSGDFTNTIGDTKPGDRARIEGPYGRFSCSYQTPSSFVFIAGGVGITPLMSMLRYLRDTGDDRRIVLIYGNRTEGDIIFRNELAALPDNVRVTHVLSDAEHDWEGRRGFVTADVMRECCGDLLGEADAYVCGPPVMMTKVVKALRSLGVEDRRIHYERFEV